MPGDEIDAGEVLKKLAELKRTLSEAQYQEIRRQVLRAVAEHCEGRVLLTATRVRLGGGSIECRRVSA